MPQVVAQAECIDFLLHFFQGQLMVIPHADIILHLFILASWDIHRAVIMVGKAFCNVTRIPLIRFDFFFPLITGMVVGARITHVILCSVSWWYRV